MLDYEEFKQEVVNDIKDYLSDRFTNADVNIIEVTKNNDVHLDGLQIMHEDSNIAPTIYLNNFYGKYEQSGDLEEIMTEIADIRERSDFDLPIDVSDMSNLDKVRDHIDCRVLGTENNQEYLRDKPHKTVAEDLAVVYSVRLGGAADGIMNAVVTDQMLDRWGISVDELHDIAISNTEILSPVELVSMREMLMDMMLPGDPDAIHDLDMFIPDEGPQMYVLTNHDKVYGAKEILNQEVMDKIADKLDGDFIVLPSSVHEVLILPDAEHVDRAALEDMVQTINQNELDAKEVLSNNVYCYDFKEHELVRAETYVDRQNERKAEKAAQKENGEKKAEKTERKEDSKEQKSVKDKIAEKKDIASKMNLEKGATTKNHQASL